MTAKERQAKYRTVSREKWLATHKRYRENHREKTRREGRERERIRRERTKSDLLNAAGGKCAVCGFSDTRALHIDHVQNDGATEEKRFRLNSVKYQRYVMGALHLGKYQILCANCNHIKEWEKRRANRLP